jgi:hypothetical protein
MQRSPSLAAGAAAALRQVAQGPPVLVRVLPRRARRDRSRCRAVSGVGEVVQQSKNRRGRPCDERAELHDGCQHRCDRFGNYPVGSKETPSGVVSSWHHSECEPGLCKSPLPSSYPRIRWSRRCCRNPKERRYFAKYQIFLLEDDVIKTIEKHNTKLNKLYEEQE